MSNDMQEYLDLSYVKQLWAVRAYKHTYKTQAPMQESNAKQISTYPQFKHTWYIRLASSKHFYKILRYIK